MVISASTQKRNLFGPYFERLQRIGSNWLVAISITLTVESQNGTSILDFNIPAEFLSKTQNEEYFMSIKIPNPTLTSILAERELFSYAPDIFEFNVKSNHNAKIVTRNNIIFIKILDRNIKEDFIFSLKSLSLQHAISEPVPFNRSMVEIEFQWSSLIIRPHVRLMIRRPRTLVTCFTSGNYTMAYPSRYDADNATTHILFPPSMNYVIRYGFSSEEQSEVSDILGSLILLMISCVLLYFLTSYVKIKADTDISNFLVPLMVLLGPIYIGLSKYTGVDRLHYYIRKSSIVFRISMILSFITGINIAIFIYSVFNSNYLESYNIVKFIPMLYISQSIVAIFALLLLIVIYRIGMLVRYACDNQGCQKRIYYRFKRDNCFATGRIMCDACYDRLCEKCLCNLKINRYALSTGISYDEKKSENLCQKRN